MDVFKSSPTSLRHDEEENHCVEDRQAAKEKIWSAVGICEENRNDENDTEVCRLRAHQHLALMWKPLSTDPIGTLS